MVVKGYSKLSSSLINSSPKSLQRDIATVLGRNDVQWTSDFPFLEIGVRSPMQKRRKTIASVKIICLTREIFPFALANRTIDDYKGRLRNADHQLLVTQAIERLTSRPSPQPSPPAAHPPVSQPNESAVPYDQPSCSVPVDLIPPPQHTRKSSRLSSSSPTVPLPTPKIDDFPIPKPGTSRRPIPENRRITRSLSRQD